MAHNFNQYMNFEEVNKPWGGYKRFTLNQPSTVKLLTISPEQRFSLQKHKNRMEFWKVLKGNPLITIGNETFEALPNEEIFIEKETIHRIQATDKTVLILEIAFGDFDEEDIVRVEDDYGRA